MLTAKAEIWLRALRLKFYPMSWVVYAMGTVLAAGSPVVFTEAVFWLGFGFIFFLEVATVLSNEYFDFESDSYNDLHGPFSGGSRVLVNEELSHREILAGMCIALCLMLFFFMATVSVPSPHSTYLWIVSVILALLALGYTVPPLRFSWRSLGEIDVGITNSIGVMLYGYILLGGNWNDPAPWVLSLPLLLAFIPSITLCAIPDFEADRRAGKQTLAVRLGIPSAAVIAGLAAVFAAVLAVSIQAVSEGNVYGELIYLSLFHAGILAWLSFSTLKRRRQACRIDSLITLSLLFVPWFCVLPLLYLIL